jgi:hypothetical protein
MKSRTISSLFHLVNFQKHINQHRRVLNSQRQWRLNCIPLSKHSSTLFSVEISAAASGLSRVKFVKCVATTILRSTEDVIGTLSPCLFLPAEMQGTPAQNHLFICSGSVAGFLGILLSRLCHFSDLCDWGWGKS